MAQLVPVVLKNDAAADVTFTPREYSNGVAVLTNGTGVAISDKRMTIQVSRTKDQGRTKVQLKFVVPVVQNSTINGITRPAVVRTAYADLTMSFDPTSESVEREDIAAFVASALNLNAQPMIASIIQGNESLY